MKKNIILLLLIFGVQHANSQIGWDTLLYDDFSDCDARQWTLDETWTVSKENENCFLTNNGFGSCLCNLGSHWDVYSISFSFKILSGGFNINMLSGESGGYLIAIHEDMLLLLKQMRGAIQEDSILFETNLTLSKDVWHTAKITVDETVLQVMIDGDFYHQYVREGFPLKNGNTFFEGYEESIIYIDNVLIFGPFQPEPPEGLIWKRTGGPPGGLGYDIRQDPVNPDILYVTDNPSGVYKSNDGGLTWNQVNQGIYHEVLSPTSGALPVFSLSMDPSDEQTLWCGLQNARGIFLSEDGGDSWLKRDNGISEMVELSIRGFAVHPDNPDIVIAAGEIEMVFSGDILGRSKGVIYKTKDKGKNWYKVWEGNSLARVVIFDYQNPDVVYCSTGIFDRKAFNSDPISRIAGGEGILKSNDGGETWKPVNNGIENLYVGFLEMHPENPQILYAATGSFEYYFEPLGKIYKTTNGGESWNEILADQCFSVVTLSKTNPERIYALSDSYWFTSTDGGNNWDTINSDLTSFYNSLGYNPGIPISAVVDSRNEERLFVNNYGGGNIMTGDGGLTWKDASAGYSGSSALSIFCNPQEPSNIISIANVGIFKSHNGGKEWVGINGYEINTIFNEIDVVYDRDTTYIIGAQEEKSSLNLSKDMGETWQEVFVHPQMDTIIYGTVLEHIISCVKFAPSDRNVIYAGMFKQEPNEFDPLPSSSYGMYRSINGGSSWQSINNDLEYTSKAIYDIAIHPANSNIVYISLVLDGIYKTSDGGGSWYPVNNGLSSTEIRSIAIDPMNPETIYAGAGDGKGIFKSTNGGVLWSEITVGINVKCPSYLSSAGKADMEYSANSKSMGNINAGYDHVEWTKIMDIIVDPSNSDIIYAGDYYSGVYQSENGGKTWNKLDNGLIIPNITDLSVSNDGSVLYAATRGGGVYRLVKRNIAPVISASIPLDEEYTIYNGDSTKLEVFVHDLNDDTLSYSWTVNNVLFEGYDSTTFDFFSTEFGIGDYSIVLHIADADTIINKEWIVHVLDVNVKAQNIEYKDDLITAYPNPFNQSVEFEYMLNKPGIVSLELFDLSGKLILTIFKQKQNTGIYKYKWDGTSATGRKVSQGIYICKMRIFNSTQTIHSYAKLIRN